MAGNEKKKKKSCSHSIAFRDGSRNIGIFKSERKSTADETRSQRAMSHYPTPQKSGSKELNSALWEWHIENNKKN